MKRYFFKYFEITIWIVALCCLAFTNPAEQGHYSLCPFNRFGFSWCPGCGLGHSIAYLFRGDFANSFKAHWLGMPVVAVLLFRIYTLIRFNNRLADPFSNR
ncbi:DUF2752 domain-containing protein [Mucilaginibacter pallidiroseus]|uniref:DUF2752 domain-containing protein n=1 Tax=Mucilaginibacter pallidiroseus TaxID=2599295 RepID=A0A563UFB8_9SPHI|nr:DUF2752 domain-containing protein [Mucilaginibacter pallidiroseus]